MGSGAITSSRDHENRNAFLSLPLVVLGNTSIGRLTPSFIAVAAGRSELAFLAEFPDMEAYFSALQLRAFNERLHSIVSRVEDFPVGMPRLRVLLTEYLH